MGSWGDPLVKGPLCSYTFTCFLKQAPSVARIRWVGWSFFLSATRSSEVLNAKRRRAEAIISARRVNVCILAFARGVAVREAKGLHVSREDEKDG